MGLVFGIIIALATLALATPFFIAADRLADAARASRIRPASPSAP